MAAGPTINWAKRFSISDNNIIIGNASVVLHCYNFVSENDHVRMREGKKCRRNKNLAAGPTINWAKDFPFRTITSLLLLLLLSLLYCGLSYFVISGHPQIWIVGDSIVRRAKERAAATSRLQLGTPYTIQWHGQGGARLEDVERMVDNCTGLCFLLPHQ